jgi:hypothetical protein
MIKGETSNGEAVKSCGVPALRVALHDQRPVRVLRKAGVLMSIWQWVLTAMFMTVIVWLWSR